MPHTKMIPYLKIFGGLVVALAILVIALVELALFVIGLSTTPEDFQALALKMPIMAKWLFATPWPVPTALLMIAAAFAAWLIWSGTRQTVKREIESHPNAEKDQIEAIVSAILSARAANDPITSHPPEFEALNRRLTDIEATMTGLDAPGTAKRFSEIVASGLSDLRARVEEVLAYTEKRFRDQEDTFENTDGGFAAIHHREQLASIGAEIDQAASFLTNPRRGERVENWDLWNSREHEFRAQIERWLKIADGYRFGCAERINDLSPDRINGDWGEPDSLFPSTAAMLAYRYAAVRYDNFKAEQAQVDYCVKLAAYARPSQKGRAKIPVVIDQPSQP